ncbi:hypothetical protein AB0L65_33445 [Nonomuraea sp. NPDC052116]|uniref:hypothetical protein n=1 Tax=Nonomuraea sp. NPDC052116 TaxID=3155665 RepID=UPI00343A6D8A
MDISAAESDTRNRLTIAPITNMAGPIDSATPSNGTASPASSPTPPADSHTLLESEMIANRRRLRQTQHLDPAGPDEQEAQRDRQHDDDGAHRWRLQRSTLQPTAR